MVLVVVLVWMTVFMGLLASPLRFRESTLAASTFVGVALLGITEGLSLFHAITPVGLALSWLLVLLALLVVLRRRLPMGYDRLREQLKVRLRRTDVALFSILGLFVTGSLSRAVLYPPSNWDSLTYHLPRVFFWLQNQSVAHFPTAEPRQLFSSPFANYAVLHVQAMTGGGDRFVGLPHVAAYVFMLVAVSLIALRLGATTRGQWFATLTAASVPMAILQAPTTQNDLMCATWCLIAAYGVVGLVEALTTDDDSAISISAWSLWAAGAAALAFLTKPTAVFVLAPFAVWLLVTLARSATLSRSLRVLGLGLIAAVLLCLPWFARNANTLDGDFLALSAPGNTHLLTAARSPAGLATNALMNASMLFAVPIDELNPPLERLVESAAGHLGVSKLESVMGEPGYGPYKTQHAVWDHGVAPAPVTVWLLVASCIAIVLFWRGQSRLALAYLAAALTGLVVTFSTLGWQPWISRLVLPSMLSLTPVAGLAFSIVHRRSLGTARVILSTLLALSLMLGALVMLFDVHHRLVPMPRSFWNTSFDELRYRAAPDLAPALRGVVHYLDVSGARRVGLNQLEGDFPSYLLLASIRDHEVLYVDRVVLGERFRTPKEPDIVVGLMREDQHEDLFVDVASSPPQVLLQPQTAVGWTVLIYRN